MEAIKKKYNININIADVKLPMVVPEGTKDQQELFEGSYRKAGNQINENVRECKSNFKVDDKEALAYSYLASLQRLETEKSIQINDAIKKLEKLNEMLN